MTFSVLRFYSLFSFTFTQIEAFFAFNFLDCVSIFPLESVSAVEMLLSSDTSH